MRKSTILLKKQFQKKFDKKGYIKLPKIIEIEMVQLRNLVKTLNLEFPDKNTFFALNQIEDLQKKTQASDKILKILRGFIEKHLINYRIMCGSILIKPSNTSCEMPIHQDSSLVDETKHSVCSLWIPLQDTDSNNGCLKICEGSHEVNTFLRGPSLPSYYSNSNEFLEKKAVKIELKSGEPVFFNQSVFHGSFANSSLKPRIAILVGLVSKEAALNYPYYEDGYLYKIKMPDDYILKHNNFNAFPKIGTIASKKRFEPYILSKQEFQQLYIEKTKVSIFHKMLHNIGL